MSSRFSSAISSGYDFDRSPGYLELQYPSLADKGVGPKDLKLSVPKILVGVQNSTLIHLVI